MRTRPREISQAVSERMLGRERGQGVEPSGRRLGGIPLALHARASNTPWIGTEKTAKDSQVSLSTIPPSPARLQGLSRLRTQLRPRREKERKHGGIERTLMTARAWSFILSDHSGLASNTRRITS